MTTEKTIVVLLGFPRSGSNHFLSVLSGFSSVSAGSEVFNWWASSVHDFKEPASITEAKFQHLIDSLDLKISPAEGKTGPDRFAFSDDLKRAMHQRPKETVRALAAFDDAPVYAFKIFPQHLRTGRVRKILQLPNTLVCTLRRSPIDSFISWKKKNLVRAFANRDTSDVKVVLDAVEFADFLDGRKDWIDFIGSIGNPTVHFSYDAISGLKNEDLAKMQEIQFSKVDVSLGQYQGNHARFRKQDTAPDWRLKIENAEEFEENCKTLGINPELDLSQWPKT